MLAIVVVNVVNTKNVAEKYIHQMENYGLKPMNILSAVKFKN